MAFCARCGGEVPAAARFCPACGRPVEPEVGPPAPPPGRSILAGYAPPAWVTSDWALVGLGVAVMLALLFGGAALVGMVAGAAVAGDLGAAPCGAAVGSHLAFAAFGARTFAGCGSENAATLAIAFLPLPWALVGGLAVEAARRFAWRRLPDDRVRRVAYGAKLALAFGIVLGVVAGLVARGDPNRRGSGFASSLNGGEVWFYATVLTWFWAWLALRRQGLRLGIRARGRFALAGRLGRPAGEGAAGFALLAVGLAVVGVLFALLVADSGRERIGIVFGFPVVGFSFGAAMLDTAMGAALGGANHLSLLHFGLPARPGAGAAPAWLFVSLLLAPGIAAATAWRRLEADRPADEQAALAIGAATGLGFAVAVWLAALLGRIVLLSGVRLADGESVGAFIAARPNPASVLGLALLWGLVGGLGAAFVWASKHNARWPVAGPAGEATPPAAPADTAWLLPETPPAAVPPPEPPPAPGGQEGAGGSAGVPPAEKP